MTVLNWSRDLEVGIREIDVQHRNLVAIANHLHDAILAGQAPQALSWILDELALYTVHHFDAEEKLMQVHDFVESPQHHLEHKSMLKAVQRFHDRFGDGDARVQRDVMDFLRGWLLQHIQGTDRKLAEELRQKGVR